MNQPFDWDGLLECIEDRLVIPIVGAELLCLEHEGGVVPLEELLARELARAFALPLEGELAEPTLNRVAGHLLQQGMLPQRLYARLSALLRELAPPPPEPLRALAGIEGFSLYVSTTPDDLLLRALDQVRHGGEARTRSLVYSIRGEQDLPAAALPEGVPLVFQLFGRISPAADYVLTERDRLEFVRMLQMPDKRPQRLLDLLHGHQLLLLGCGFPDWLARFFLDLVTDLWSPAQRIAKTLVDGRGGADRDQVLFLHQCGVEVCADLAPAEFALELGRRWRERHPGQAHLSGAAASPLPSSGAAAPGEEMEEGAVFLSYASEDAAAVRRVAERLEAAGIPVWLDKKALEPGTDYRQRILKNINQCSFFIPFISAHSAGRPEGFYREEWDWALQRRRRLRPDYPFIQPVVLDETSYRAGGLPMDFYSLHWTWLSGGEPGEGFVSQMKDQLRQIRRSEALRA